ncbi:hypothetical protein GIB67_015511 [Kingdonia uniflora]|uniref:Uncharacterized protein n=1 Tax=Kingdonia uniflora TaxID=39325 RepID=A0A7J7LAL3_9MAGN|nr:hypothetical protein GIB67_015511 [Kingdonia uniflora]
MSYSSLRKKSDLLLVSKVKIGLLRQFLINLQVVSLGTKLAVLFSAIALAIIAQSYNFGRREKEATMNKILTLEKELDAKQKLELEITELKGKMKVMNHIEGKDDNGVQHKMKEMQEELEEKEEEMGDMESMNTTLTGVEFGDGGGVWVVCDGCDAAAGLFRDSGGLSAKYCRWSFGLLARIDSAGALHRVTDEFYLPG